MYTDNNNVEQCWTRDKIAFVAIASDNEAVIEAAAVYEYHALQKYGDGWRYHYSTDPQLGHGWVRDRIA